MAHHVLPACHHSFVYDLGRVVSPGIDVHALFHHRVGSRPQCLASLVATWLDLRLELPGMPLGGHDGGCEGLARPGRVGGELMRCGAGARFRWPYNLAPPSEQMPKSQLRNETYRAKRLNGEACCRSAPVCRDAGRGNDRRPTKSSLQKISVRSHSTPSVALVPDPKRGEVMLPGCEWPPSDAAEVCLSPAHTAFSTHALHSAHFAYVTLAFRPWYRTQCMSATLAHSLLRPLHPALRIRLTTVSSLVQPCSIATSGR